MTTQTTLLDIISNHLVLTQLAPYLTPFSLFRLAATSHAFYNTIVTNPNAFRRVDLSTVRSVRYEDLECAVLHNSSVDYEETRCLPLSKLCDIFLIRDILPTIQTLILDRQCVHVEMIRELFVTGSCQIRLLSLIGVKGLDPNEFQHLMNDMFRGGRRPDSPPLEGIYFFGPPEVYTMSFNAKDVGSERPDIEDDPNPWYLRSTTAIQPELYDNSMPHSYSPSALLRATQESLSWDAVLCRAAIHTYPNPGYRIPVIARWALGTTGCHLCHSAPEGPGSGRHQLPLLSPPPLYSSAIKVAQQSPSDSGSITLLPFYARCGHCVKDRWCAMCNKWWCEDCYRIGGLNCYMEYNLQGIGSVGTKTECDACGPLCSTCFDRDYAAAHGFLTIT
ncbi:hypothetical protein B0O99DRAFT_591161 [Bisporella sp. PMI_857]|nr:hypothetical protein B0O99DRAFT_591161 [Bisporella sp. PMI_857]